jgi:hypothetical protein
MADMSTFRIIENWRYPDESLCCTRSLPASIISPNLLYVFKMDMVDLGPLNLKEAVISTSDGMKACQDYGKAVGKKLQA